MRGFFKLVAAAAGFIHPAIAEYTTITPPA
jgi:hypothetical protein